VIGIPGVVHGGSLTEIHGGSITGVYHVRSITSVPNHVNVNERP
jgi:hypothetical protein